MRTLCAWCGKVLVDGPEEAVSHGICPDCRDKEMAKIGKDFPECECLWCGNIFRNPGGAVNAVCPKCGRSEGIVDFTLTGATA